MVEVRSSITRRWFPRAPWAVILVSVVFGLVASGAEPALGGMKPQYRQDRVLAKPKKAISGAALVAGIRSRGTAVSRTYGRMGNLRVLRINDGENVDRKIEKLRRSGLFEYVERDYLLSADNTPDDPHYLNGSLWWLHNEGQSNGTNDADIDAPEAWDLRTSAPDVIVAVIDSGARYTHEDLAGNIWTNAGEIPGNGLDDDGNGYVDDVHGINAITGSGNPADDDGHGTHVAGILGAVGNNAVGISGVAWSIKIMPLKFLAANGVGSTSDAIECINYAVMKGATIMNNSWGGGSGSQALRDAIVAARDAGIIFVAAAGNSTQDNDSQGRYPANFPVDNVVAVAATGRSDELAYYSNYGFGYVNVAAPGSDVLSTWNSSDNAYDFLNGTSMSVPQVVGALALLKVQFPTDNYLQLINRLERSVDQLPGLTGKCKTGGRINLHTALTSTRNSPFNDDFAESSGIVSSGLHIRSQNYSATSEPGEPLHAGEAGSHSVWWSWTPDFSGEVAVSTVGSDFDTLLAVYTGSLLSALTLVGSNDDNPTGGDTSRFFLNVVQGITYRIAVDGKNGAQGLVILSVGVPALNDDFSAAIELSGTIAHATGVNRDTSKEIGEPAHAGDAGGNSVWWKWTAPLGGGSFEVDTIGSDFDTLLGIYSGSAVNSLTLVASNNDEPNSGLESSRVVFSAVGGTTYYIAVDGLSRAYGNINLNVVPAPSNDNFSMAIAKTGLSFSESGSNVGSSWETGEPEYVFFTGYRSVWWSWTAPETRDFVIDTVGSSFDTAMAIYTGSAINALTLVDRDDDSGGNFASSVTISATAGTTYRISVDGRAGATGSIVLNLGPVLPPPNDDFANRTALNGPIIHTTGTNVHASAEPGEPAHHDIAGEPSVWWTWSAEVSGPVQIDTLGSNFDTVLAVYVGSSLITLSEIASNDDFENTSQSGVTFNAAAGTNYQIAVIGFVDEGIINLNIVPLPTVDIFASQPHASETGLTPGAVTFSRTGPTALPLVINYMVTGTASNGVDYTFLGGLAEIPSGMSQVLVPVQPLADGLLEEVESVTVMLQPGAGYAIGPATSATVTIADNRIELWRQTHFGTTANSGNAANLANPDADAASNLLEFAIGTNPNDGSDTGPLLLNQNVLVRRGTPIVIMESDPGGGNFHAIFVRRKDYAAAGLTYTVQFSGDLLAWESSSATPVVIADGGEVEAVSVAYPLLVNGQQTRFFRLQISIIP